jgi:hypothetical protein
MRSEAAIADWSGIHGERGEDAEAERAVENAIASGPVDKCGGEDAENFDGGVKKRKGENRVAPGNHVFAIATAEFSARLLFAIEELHDAHAGDVFLKVGVDAGNSGADAAVGVANVFAEEKGDDEDEGKHGECVEREATIYGKEPAGEDGEKEEIVDHGHDAGGEEIVEGIDVGGDARNQAADRIAIEVGHRQPLDMAEDRGAHVVHRLLADALHDANLDILREEVEEQHAEENDADDGDAAPRCRLDELVAHAGDEIFVDGDLKKFRWRELERRDDRNEGER